MDEREARSESTFLVVDTNVLIQCRSLSELDWRAAAPGAAEITVLMTLPVLRELDRFKADGNTRRARRAKSILRRIRPLFDGSNPEGQTS